MSDPSDDDTVEIVTPPFSPKPPAEDRGALGVQFTLPFDDADSEGGAE